MSLTSVLLSTSRRRLVNAASTRRSVMRARSSRNSVICWDPGGRRRLSCEDQTYHVSGIDFVRSVC